MLETTLASTGRGINFGSRIAQPRPLLPLLSPVFTGYFLLTGWFLLGKKCLLGEKTSRKLTVTVASLLVGLRGALKIPKNGKKETPPVADQKG